MKGGFRVCGFVGVEPPYAPSLFALDFLGDGSGEFFERRAWDRYALEEAPLPFAAFGLLFLAELALGIFDFALLDADGVHVGLLDGSGDVLPCSVGFVGVLLIERGDYQGSCFGGFGTVGVNRSAGFLCAIMDGEAIGPLTFGCV